MYAYDFAVKMLSDPIRSYLSSIRLYFRSNVLSKNHFKNSKAIFESMKSIKERIHLQNTNIKRFINMQKNNPCSISTFN